jgi:acetylornithine deacetylase/succinyl-diaminopimelate desuccinylase-like protein
VSQSQSAPAAELSSAEAVRALMPELVDDLKRLVAIPSIASAEGATPELVEAHDLVARLLRSAGVEHIERLDLPGTAPVVVGSIPAPPGAPTVLLYSHYDVVGAGDESLWTSPPFVPTERDGTLVGRGAADSKANVIAHVGALRAWGGRPPVGIKLVIEGQEEVGGGALNAHPETDPELFRADAMLIADMGSLRPGFPTLTVALRGMANVTVGATTLASGKHSGQYGGAAPDAQIALLHALSTLHDENGDVSVAGLLREEWKGGGMDEDEFRRLAEIEGDLPLKGTGGLGSRIWSGPAITVTGIDGPSVEDAVNAVAATARAALNLRVHPAQDPVEAQNALIEHLRAQQPFGISLHVEPGPIGHGFWTTTDGAAYTAARTAMETAWGEPPIDAATGGSIPLVAALHRTVPEAEILLLGACDGYANIHGPDERLVLDELERFVVAEVEFFRRYGATDG